MSLNRKQEVHLMFVDASENLQLQLDHLLKRRIPSVEWRSSSFNRLTDTVELDVSDNVVIVKLPQLIADVQIKSVKKILQRRPLAIIVLTNDSAKHAKIKKALKGGHLHVVISTVPTNELEELLVPFMEKVLGMHRLKKELVETYEEILLFGGQQTRANALILEMARLTGLSHTKVLRELGNPAFQKAEKNIKHLME